MNSDQIKELISKQLSEFHQHRIAKLQGLSLKRILKRKNPYLFKAVGKNTIGEIVEGMLLAYISSSDEGIFGAFFFEPIAKEVSGAKTSDGAGVDLLIESEDRVLAVSVKSGPNPYNSSAKKRQNQEFMELRSRLLKVKKSFDAMLGYAYGYCNKPATKDRVYREVGGKAFWEELTGDPNFYIQLFQLMDEELIKSFKDRYNDEWQNAINKYTLEFGRLFCQVNGAIDWERVLKFNSGGK